MVTPERRSAIEKLHPDAKGFLTSETIEEKLFAMNIKRGKDAEALRALDRLAAGKWILTTGHISEARPDRFELAIRYTPRDATDPMGVTSQWVSVEFSGIEGYDSSEYRPGERAAILAKYDGKRKAGPGYDLLLLGQWYPASSN